MKGVKTGLRAKDIMTPEPVCVTPSTTIRRLARVLEENEISGAPVVDQQGAVIGIVSKTDLIRRCMEGTADVPPAYLFEIIFDHATDDDDSDAGGIIPEPLICVEDLMTEDPVAVSPETSISEIARLMCEHRIHRVPVTDEDDCPVGIITTLDILGVLQDASASRTQH